MKSLKDSRIKRVIPVLLALVLIMFTALPAVAQRTGRTGVQDSVQQHTLTVDRNPGNATILIDGRRQRGNRFTLPAGRYTITVEADGYVSESRVVLLDRTLTVSFQLQAEGKRPGNRTSGGAPVITPVPEAEPEAPPAVIPGRPSGNVPGRPTGRDSETSNRVPPGTLVIEFPDRLANAFFYIDGQRRPVNSRRAQEALQLEPGIYRLQLEVGGLMSPEVQVQIEPGRTLRLAPKLMFEVLQ
ncbi:MAG: PEGA domain-containing protein [Spirochaetaceae bacterium]|nr:MAG: PEGA domain-containing protein [Spirochaetaceae bacterium]